MLYSLSYNIPLVGGFFEALFLMAGVMKFCDGICDISALCSLLCSALFMSSSRSVTSFMMNIPGARFKRTLGQCSGGYPNLRPRVHVHRGGRALTITRDHRPKSIESRPSLLV